MVVAWSHSVQCTILYRICSPFLLGLVLELLLAAGRPHIPSQWSCRGQVEMQSLRRLQAQVGRLMEHDHLPAIIVEGDKASINFARFLFEDTCLGARWTMELLVAELAMKNSEVGNNGSSWAAALAADGDIHDPFTVFFRVEAPRMLLFHELLWGTGTAWASVSAGGWSTFALMARLSRSFQTYLTKQGKAASEALEALLRLQPTKARHHMAERAPAVLSTAQAFLQAANLSEPWAHRAAATAAAEKLVRSWSRAALNVGLPPWQLVAALLLDAQAPHFWHLLDEVLLPDAVRICIPQVLGMQSSSRCSANHCTKLWGLDQAQPVHAQRNHSAVGDLAVFRVESKRDLLNDNIRSECNISCPQAVVGLLGKVSEMFRDQVVPGTAFTYVDVGAALGECMMSAAFLLPAGRLHGIAFEALPNWASRMRETLRINGIFASGLPNKTRVLVRSVALGRGKSKVLGTAGGP